MVGPVGALTFYVRLTDHLEKDHFRVGSLATDQSDDAAYTTYDQVGWNLRAFFDFVYDRARAFFFARQILKQMRVRAQG